MEPLKKLVLWHNNLHAWDDLHPFLTGCVLFTFATVAFDTSPFASGVPAFGLSYGLALARGSRASSGESSSVEGG
jgi:hypothetical protein